MDYFSRDLVRKLKLVKLVSDILNKLKHSRSIIEIQTRAYNGNIEDNVPIYPTSFWFRVKLLPTLKE